MKEDALLVTSTGFPTVNSRLMMRVLRDAGDLSRTSLSEATGLSATTVSKAVAPLMARGWVMEGGVERPSAVGRPALVVSPVPAATIVCGIQIGVGYARIGLADGRAKVLRMTEFSYEPQLPAGAVLKSVAKAALRLIAKSATPCLGIGVGVPGPVDAAQRVNLMSINLGWRDVPVADRLEELVGLPVFVDHNVRAMAVAEHSYGGHKVSSMAYVYVKTGVGLGLVLQGEPFAAGSHGISELGHIQVQQSGRRCACGSTGCLETVVSEPALIAALREAGVVVPADRAPLQVMETHRDAPAVEAVRQSVIDTLSRGLGAVMNLINPELIVLGGVFEEAPDALLADLRTGVKLATFPLLRDHMGLSRPSLPIPGVSGGAALALEKTVYS